MHMSARKSTGPRSHRVGMQSPNACHPMLSKALEHDVFGIWPRRERRCSAFPKLDGQLFASLGRCASKCLPLFCSPEFRALADILGA